MAKENKSPVSKKVEDIKPEDKRKALETALTQIKKQFGEGAVMRLGQNNGMHVDAISTGSLSLDLALGIGGLPRGRIIEIYGPESSGKTTLALHCVAEGQKMGGNAAFIDVEHALDPVYASALGVDVDSLLVSQPDTGEQALEITEALVRSNAIDVIVVDSVAALVPRAEIEGEMGDSHVGLQARLMSQALRKLAGAISKSNCVAIFINQLREKVGVVYGNPEVTPGGRALKFYASVRMDIRSIGKICVILLYLRRLKSMIKRRDGSDSVRARFFCVTSEIASNPRSYCPYMRNNHFPVCGFDGTFQGLLSFLLGQKKTFSGGPPYIYSVSPAVNHAFCQPGKSIIVNRTVFFKSSK